MKRYFILAMLALPMLAQAQEVCTPPFSPMPFHTTQNTQTGEIRQWLCVHSVTGEVTANFGAGATLTATQVAFGSGTNTITSEAAFIYLSGTDSLIVGTAGSGTVTSGGFVASNAVNANSFTNTGVTRTLGASTFTIHGDFVFDSTANTFTPSTDNTHDIGSPTNRMRGNYSLGFLARRPGGIQSLVNRDAFTVWFVEEWLVAGAVCSITAPGRPCGEGSWWLQGGGGATDLTGANNTLGHPGLRSFSTPGTGAGFVAIEWTAAAGSLVPANNFDIDMVVQPQDAADVTYLFGMGRDFSAASAGAHGFRFEFNSATDTNWMFVCRNAAVETRNDTGVAFAEDTWTTGRIVNDDGAGANAKYAICVGDTCTLPALTTVSTNCSTSSVDELRQGLRVVEAAAVVKRVWFDYADVLVTLTGR